MRYIYCHPLFDERKCAHRFSYQLAKSFNRNNLKLERFDYDGTGDADGRFCDVTIENLRNNLKKIISGEKVCLMGTRFGATVAFDFCCQSNSVVHTLVLIEPVVNGQRYVEYLFRKQRLKDMMTGNKSNLSHGDGFINLEGYKTNSKFLDQIRGLNLFQTLNQIRAGSVFIIQISVCARVYPEYDLLAEHLLKNGIPACVETFNLPVFWERIPDGDYAVANEQILEWCR